MNKKLEEYEAAFNEQFPLMLCMGMGDAEIIKLIENCLKYNAPYEPETGDDLY